MSNFHKAGLKTLGISLISFIYVAGLATVLFFLLFLLIGSMIANLQQIRGPLLDVAFLSLLVSPGFGVTTAFYIRWWFNKRRNRSA